MSVEQGQWVLKEWGRWVDVQGGKWPYTTYAWVPAPRPTQTESVTERDPTLSSETVPDEGVSE